MSKAKKSKKAKTATCEKPVKKQILKGIHISADLETATPIMEDAPKAEKKKKEIPEDQKNGIKALKDACELAKRELGFAEVAAEESRKQTQERISVAREAFSAALRPYKVACDRVGIECEFRVKRSAVTERVRFLIEKVEDGICVQIKDRPETSEIMNHKDLKKSVLKMASAYCEKHIGPASEIGAKHAGLYLRIRKALGLGGAHE